MGRGRVIGKDNKLLWHIPEDLKRFKQLTLGHPVVMGRKTFESIVTSLGKPLPWRTNIVVTRDTAWSFPSPEVVAVHSIEEAVEKAAALDEQEIFIEGGGQIWEQSIGMADKLYLTLIDDEKESDALFPEYESLFTKITFHEHREHEGLKYLWVDLEKE